MNVLYKKKKTRIQTLTNVSNDMVITDAPVNFRGRVVLIIITISALLVLFFNGTQLM